MLQPRMGGKAYSTKFWWNVKVIFFSRLSQTQSSDSLPTHIEQFRARSESSSQPSEGYTPSLEEYKKHKRELSECSSIGMTKAMITPSTTASNSPANFSKSQFINSQDKSLDCINELELASRGSDDSGTESERDRIRRMQQQKAMMSASPCSHNNMINYQYVQGHDPEYLRGHADGSLCGSSHHSLASSGHACMHSYPQLNLPEPRHFSRRRVGTEVNHPASAIALEYMFKCPSSSSTCTVTVSLWPLLTSAVAMPHSLPPGSSKSIIELGCIVAPPLIIMNTL